MHTNQRKPSSIAPRDVIRPQATTRASVRGAKAVGSWVPRLTQRAFEKFGFSAATLLTDWATIVGVELARFTEPQRLKWPRTASGDASEPEQGRPAATLVLGVDPSRALDLQYRARQIAERINAYFGYRAVVDIRLVQVPDLAERNNARATLAISTPAKPYRPPAEIRSIADDGLREALARMGAGLEARSSG